MNTNPENPLFDDFDDDEIDVARFMPQLSTRILQSDILTRFSPPPCWGAKRRRSAIDFSPSPPQSSGPSLHPPALCCGGEREKPTSKVEATSPATPLSFSPSESDVKSKRSKRKLFKKRTKEELADIVVNLTAQNGTLTKEIEIVRPHYNDLKAFNLKLKARERELRLKEEEQNFNSSKSVILEKEVTEPKVGSPTPTSRRGEQQMQQLTIIVHQSPLIIDQTVNRSEVSIDPNGEKSSWSLLSGVELKMGKLMTPLGIPDLNTYPVEETQTSGIDYFPSVAAAQARKRRIQIIKLKNLAKSETNRLKNLAKSGRRE